MARSANMLTSLKCLFDRVALHVLIHNGGHQTSSSTLSKFLMLCCGYLSGFYLWYFYSTLAQATFRPKQRA